MTGSPLMKHKTIKSDQIENLKGFVRLDTNHYSEAEIV
jgi:hypothetical protein